MALEVSPTKLSRNNISPSTTIYSREEKKNTPHFIPTCYGNQTRVTGRDRLMGTLHDREWKNTN